VSADELVAGLDGLLEAVWLVDPESLCIVSANAAAARLQGLDIDSLQGARAVDMGATLQDQTFWEEVGRGEPSRVHHETRLRHAEGHSVLVERRVSRLRQPGHPERLLVAMLDKSAEERSRQRFETLLTELRATLESTADGLLVCDLDGNIRAYNRLFARLWALPQELQLRRDDTAILAFLDERCADPAGHRSRFADILSDPLKPTHDLVPLADGRVLERSSRPQLARGQPIGRVFTFRDVTRRVETENQLQLAAKVFESSLDAIFITDPQHHIVICNPGARRLFDRPSEELLGQSARALFHAPMRPRWRRELDRALAETGVWEGELRHRRQDGSLLPLQVSWVVLHDAEGGALNTVVFAKDLSERLAAQQRIEQLAYTDPLTGLPNRLRLGERVDQAIQAAEQRGGGFALIFLDLDRFKAINDSLGHVFGDRVLVEVAHRLRACLRQGDTLCRLGGDEFVVHLDLSDAPAAESMAQRMLEAVGRVVSIDGINFTLSCSVGIALHPDNGRSLDELVQCADTAMHEVKLRGRNHWRFYQPRMNANLLDRLRMDSSMREGLGRGEFLLHYQPKVGLSDGRVRGCEALVRWHTPEQGLVSPGAFITVAEESGFILQLGRWVLGEAVRQAAAWARTGRACQVAVNVSALQFQQADFVDTVAQCLRQHALPAGLLELELTESILVNDEGEALNRLQALHDMGVALALDDFGTGYSSLAYLRRFPLDTLKIDRSFIIAAHRQERDAAIVAAIVQMGHALGLKIVAEGVEYPEQKDLLHQLGCDLLQGFLFSQGLTAEAFIARWDETCAAQAN
jgi:diguanylate cyclase (GGDEF)-like protein/PAS domain S-box-containing protein